MRVINKYIAVSVLPMICILMTGCNQNKSSQNTESGMQQIRSHQYENAMTAFDAAEKKKENSQLVARGRGIASIGLTQYEQAADYFKEALSYSDAHVDEMDYDLNYYLAEAYTKSEQLPEAADTYTSIIQLNKKDGTAYFLRGRILLKMGEHDRAVKDFNQSMKLNSSDYDLRITIAGELADHGYEDEGKKYLTDFLTQNEKKLSDYDKGRIYYYLSDYDNAKVYLEKAQDDQNEDVILLLGKTYEKLGDYNYAASVYQNFITKHSDAAKVINQMGLCKLVTEDYQGALDAFSAALKIQNNGIEQDLEYNQIVAYEYLSDFKQASVMMNEYLQKYPADEEALREAEFLKTR